MYSHETALILIASFLSCRQASLAEKMADSSCVRKATCFEDTDVFKCFKKLLDDEVNSAYGDAKQTKLRDEQLFTLYKDKFSEELDAFFSKDNVSVVVDTNVKVNVLTKSDRKVEVSFGIGNGSALEGRKMKMSNMMPLLVIPAFAMAGIMPWVIPGLKMVVMFVGMINQMAFMSALFMLIRTYIFDTTPEENIVYLNHGYDKQHHHHHR